MNSVNNKLIEYLRFKTVEVGNLTYIVVDGNNKTLRMINLTINKDTNCDLFKSCKKTKYATQVTAMSNAIGFTTFQVKYRKYLILLI